MEPSHTNTQEQGSQESMPAWFKVGVVFSLLTVGGLFLVFNQASDVLAYSTLVHEVVDDPGRYAGRQLRVEGDLRKGSIQFVEDPCEHRFVLEKQGRALAIRFPRCVVPDTFNDAYALEVTAQGYLDENGDFVANEIIPRCPSKYEQRMREGQTPPENHRENEHENDLGE